MITLDDNVYAPPARYDGCNESIVVTADGDLEPVAEALRRASHRMMSVDETGVEHLEEALLEAAYRSGLYTPNYVSKPEIQDGGVHLYIDCKSAAPPAMGETFRRILREELERSVDHAHVSAVIDDDEDDGGYQSAFGTVEPS